MNFNSITIRSKKKRDFESAGRMVVSGGSGNGSTPKHITVAKNGSSPFRPVDSKSRFAPRESYPPGVDVVEINWCGQLPYGWLSWWSGSAKEVFKEYKEKYNYYPTVAFHQADINQWWLSDDNVSVREVSSTKPPPSIWVPRAGDRPKEKKVKIGPEVKRNKPQRTEPLPASHSHIGQINRLLNQKKGKSHG